MIQHHPAPEILTGYAAGALAPGASLVVACHVRDCALCRQETSLWESVGGALLEETQGTALSQGALDKILARLDAPEVTLPPSPDYLKRFNIPAQLAAQKIGRRRFVTPGIWFAPIDMDQGAARTYLVYAKANTVLAEHTHRGREFTHVIAGAFRDDSGLYAAGDFACTDESIHHAPAVTEDMECLCLISAEAPMQLKSFAARLVQAVTGTLY